MLSDDDEAQTNVDSKSLQMILQGSLLLQVIILKLKVLQKKNLNFKFIFFVTG